MHIQHSPPEKPTVSHSRTQAVCTPTPRQPLDGTSEVHQLRDRLERGEIIEGTAPSRKEGRGPRKPRDFIRVLVLFLSYQRPLSKVFVKMAKWRRRNMWERKSMMCDPSLWAIIQKMTQIMANHQAASSDES
ncbi:hypothetical protein O181_014286 [Austropuccinia psidii MF-1]|uniref:Uncharacterized protein n=1 Tax=Austropuccinia psidii MF-1 TaxID=1389203 RepID=A0A9Q3BXV1_9BASI|nr:hypothetical protein [Austropuccinia psidii MF-1]